MENKAIYCWSSKSEAEWARVTIACDESPSGICISFCFYSLPNRILTQWIIIKLTTVCTQKACWYQTVFTELINYNGLNSLNLIADFWNHELSFMRDGIIEAGSFKFEFLKTWSTSGYLKQWKVSSVAEKIIRITGILIMTSKHTFPQERQPYRLRKDRIGKSKSLIVHNPCHADFL